jgi:photosystem II stability/assembly factor-like uncharacterized protein
MKPIIFAAFILCLALNVRAQLNQQTDSVPSSQGWVQANTDTITFEAGSYVPINTLPCLDSAWSIAMSPIWSINSGYINWGYAPGPIGHPWMISSTYGFFSGPGDAIYRTTDAGHSWDTLHTGMQPNTSGIGCVVSPAEVFVIGSNDIAGTLDSGSTWNIQETNANDLTSISFADSAVGYTVDGEGGPTTVLKTTDKGITWLDVSDQQGGGSLGSVSAINRNVVLAVGGYQIIRTTNGGQSWNPVYGTFGTPSGIGTVCFKGAYGFAVGSKILASTDSGFTWSQQNDPTTAGLYTIAMYDSAHAVIGGANGTILVTNNGGLSWVNENPPIHDSLSVNVFPNPTNGPLQFSYTLTKGEHVTLTIFDATGATVATPLNYVFQAGLEAITFNTLNLASGSYFFSLQCEDYSTQGTFTVIH